MIRHDAVAFGTITQEGLRLWLFHTPVVPARAVQKTLLQPHMPNLRHHQLRVFCIPKNW